MLTFKMKKIEECVMVAFARNGYRLWNVNKSKIQISRDVKFIETPSIHKFVNSTVHDYGECRPQEIQKAT